MIIFWLECHLIMKKCSSEMHQFESADPVFQAPNVILGRWWPGNLLRVFLQIIDQGYYKKYLLILYPWWAKDSHLQTINTSKITSCISIVCNCNPTKCTGIIFVGRFLFSCTCIFTGYFLYFSLRLILYEYLVKV